MRKQICNLLAQEEWYASAVPAVSVDHERAGLRAVAPGRTLDRRSKCQSIMSALACAPTYTKGPVTR